MSFRYEVHFPSARFILDPQDAYARDSGTRGRHPRPIGPVRYSLLGTVVNNTPQFYPDPLVLSMVRNSSGYDLFFGEIRIRDSRTGAEERRRIELADGTYILRFESDGTQFYQRGRINLKLPQARAQALVIDFLPGYVYPFPAAGTFAPNHGPALIAGGVFDAAGRGIAGATVALQPQPMVRTDNGDVPWIYGQYVTDDAGQFCLVVPLAADFPALQQGLPAGNTVTVRFSLPAVPPNPAPPPVDLANIPFAPGQPSSLNQAALRGSVRHASGGPIAGASITVTGEAEGTISGSDGTWVHYFGLTQGNAAVTVKATLPDGNFHEVQQVPVQARQTVWVPAFAF